MDINLEVGAVTESINVTNPLPLLETQTSSTGQVMEGSYLYQLPNYQHWEKGVLYYTPQVQHSNAAWPGSLGNWSINGGNNYQIGYFEDGQLATTMNGGTTLNSVSVGVEEVKVLTAPYRPNTARHYRPHQRGEDGRHQHPAWHRRRALQEYAHGPPPFLPVDHPPATGRDSTFPAAGFHGVRAGPSPPATWRALPSRAT